MQNIYILTNRKTNKSYIGETSKTIRDVFTEHLNNQDFGEGRYTIRLLKKCQDYQSTYLVRFYIWRYNTLNNGYNTQMGELKEYTYPFEYEKYLLFA